jgi:hypothetical protein
MSHEVHEHVRYCPGGRLCFSMHFGLFNNMLNTVVGIQHLCKPSSEEHVTCDLKWQLILNYSKMIIEANEHLLEASVSLENRV